METANLREGGGGDKAKEETNNNTCIVQHNCKKCMIQSDEKAMITFDR